MKGVVRWTTGEEIEGETDNGKLTQFHSETAAQPYADSTPSTWSMFID